MAPFFFDTNAQVKDAQKLPASCSNVNAFYTHEADDKFGSAADALGNANNDGTVDLVAGAIVVDDDGFANGGAVYVPLLESNGNVKSAQKISALHGNLNAFFTFEASKWLGASVAALDDINGNSVVDLAVGAVDDDDGGSNTGAVYILFLDSSFSVELAQKV